MHPAFRALLRAARTLTTRVEVVGSPFALKDALKARGYRGDLWVTKRLWYKDLALGQDALPLEERLWLDHGGMTWRYQRLTAVTRWSGRA